MAYHFNSTTLLNKPVEHRASELKTLEKWINPDNLVFK